MLNLSGGFPARYTTPVPSLDEIASEIFGALRDHMPYLPAELAAEPGRHLVAESAVMVSRGDRPRGARRRQLDLPRRGRLQRAHRDAADAQPLALSAVELAARPRSAPADRFTVTGPTCDSSDTLFFGAALPATLDVGDRLYIGSAGAYTLSYASSFNGFGPPAVLHVG